MAWRLASRVLPENDDLVIISTFPDFDDSARAVREALVGSRYKAVFIVASGSPAPDWIDFSSDRIFSRRSLRGVITFHRARWVIITHGLYSELPRTGRQYFINLWHGMPIKKVGAMLGEELPHTDVAVAANAKYRNIMSEVLDISTEQVLVAPHPRIDILLNVREELRKQYFGDKWIFVWLPTFRDRRGGKGRRDGIPEQSVLHQISLFHKLHECLMELQAICVIKPHPMENISDVSTSLPETVQLWTDQDLNNRSLSLYQLIGLSDALITDVSSVYFEYQQLERPIFCFFPDFEAYESGRGFVRPLQTLIDDPILRTEQELIDQIQACFQGRARRDFPSAEHEGDQPTLARQVLQKCGMEIY